ncbi:hypothetical protein P885DRAFT_79339 [Corynascus similis CBS 632.67]
MRSLNTLLLALTALLPLSAAAAVAKRPAFTGPGQLRTFYIRGDHEDLGCVTSEGKWTVDESQCGVFVTERLDSNQFHLRALKAGQCGIDVATFKCGGGVKEAVFGTWGTSGPVSGTEVLRYSQYGIMATDAPDSPPTRHQEPLAMHFYSGSEKGKYVWLGWKALSGNHVEDN